MTRPRFSTLRRALVAAGLATASLGALQAQAPQNIVFWYHFDNPEQTKVMDGLVADFQAKNPGIKVEAQNIPWNNYYDRLFTAVAGGKAPDVAMVKLQQQAQLVEMGALEPIDARVTAWPGRNDLGDNLLNINKGHDGKQYYLPLQYVVIYLYYRTDLFTKAGVQPPATCEQFVDAAKKLTVAAAANGGTPQYGFGMRGGGEEKERLGPCRLAAPQQQATPVKQERERRERPEAHGHAAPEALAEVRAVRAHHHGLAAALAELFPRARNEGAVNRVHLAIEVLDEVAGADRGEDAAEQGADHDHHQRPTGLAAELRLIEFSVESQTPVGVSHHGAPRSIRRALKTRKPRHPEGDRGFVILGN